MRRVILESPYGAATAAGIAIHEDYARRCVRDCLTRGEAAIASHLLYTQPGILNDAKPDERRLGMTAGFAWTRVADAVVVYTDHGVSSGMIEGIHVAREAMVPIEYRTLPDSERPMGEAAIEQTGNVG